MPKRLQPHSGRAHTVQCDVDGGGEVIAGGGEGEDEGGGDGEGDGVGDGDGNGEGDALGAGAGDGGSEVDFAGAQAPHCDGNSACAMRWQAASSLSEPPLDD